MRYPKYAPQADNRDYYQESPPSVPYPKKKKRRRKKKSGKIPMALIVAIMVLLLIIIVDSIILVCIPSRRGGTQEELNAANRVDTPNIVIGETDTGNTAAEPVYTTPAPTPAPVPAPTSAPISVPTATPEPVTPVPARAPIISGASFKLPASISKGQPFSISGAIATDCGVITVVNAIVYDANHNIVMTCTDAPNKANYQLLNSAIDYGMSFGRLAAGSYSIEIIATANYNGAETKTTVASQQFTVEDNSIVIS